MDTVLGFDTSDLETLELVWMESTGEYRLKMEWNGAVNMISIPTQLAQDLEEFREMDKETRSESHTYGGDF